MFLRFCLCRKFNERMGTIHEGGFHFFMRHPDYLVMCDENVDIKTVEHNVGGEPMQEKTFK